MRPLGPFDLSHQNRYFGGWPVRPDGALEMAFPVEGWQSSALVTARQQGEEVLFEGPARAVQQAQEALSLDVDGRAWPEVGERDPVLGELQRRLGWLRPALFHSPYEAAAAFILGHRISIKQRRALMQRMSAPGFLLPQQLLELESFPGVPRLKLERLHAVARAAREGWLDRAALRAMPEQEALARLQTLPGVGPFFASGILYRGAGLVDVLPLDPTSREAFEKAYPGQEIERVSQTWRPFRMWAMVLLHIHWRREG